MRPRILEAWRTGKDRWSWRLCLTVAVDRQRTMSRLSRAWSDLPVVALIRRMALSDSGGTPSTAVCQRIVRQQKTRVTDYPMLLTLARVMPARVAR